MKLARELKMPVEDMCLTNHQPMPGMQCLQGKCFGYVRVSLFTFDLFRQKWLAPH